jgi:hypothetical protein
MIAYSNKALAQNEFTGLTFECPPNANPCIPISGSSVLLQFGLDSPWLWYCIIINIGLSIGFCIIGFFFFIKTSKPAMRLRSNVSSQSEVKAIPMTLIEQKNETT